MTRRHAYRKDPDREGMCTCGQGRAEDVHNMMIWHKSSGLGFYYAGPVGGMYYRIRTRLGKSATWWPEFTLLTEENYTRIGNGVGSTLAIAKAACEQHREGQE
jgi:hypothetical protein